MTVLKMSLASVQRSITDGLLHNFKLVVSQTVLLARGPLTQSGKAYPDSGRAKAEESNGPTAIAERNAERRWRPLPCAIDVETDRDSLGSWKTDSHLEFTLLFVQKRLAL